MSLKDRLNNQQKPVAPTAIKEAQPRYYATEKEAQSDSLGIVETLLADDDLNNIFISGAKNIYLEKRGKIHKSTSTFRDNVQLENILKKIATSYGTELNEENPYFKFNHSLGINATATLPPLSNVASLFIKCYKDRHANLNRMQEELSISKEIALILKALCAIRKNVLIIGDKNTLKTSLLSALAKKTQTNDRAIIIDSENEIKITGQNYTNYDFSKINDEKIADNLLDSIINIKPEKLFVNTDDEKLLTNLVLKSEDNYKGLILTLNAKTSTIAIEKLAQIIQRNYPCLNLQTARTIVLNTFDVIITVKKDEIGRRKISNISEINLLAQDDIIQEIFTLDYQNQHNSTGIVPLFYEDIKNNSLPISDNIFDVNYKHTYHKNLDLDMAAQFNKKNGNIDILKKFKKELPTQNAQNATQETPKEQVKQELSAEELMQKAQEKFDELKKTVQKQGEFEIKVEDFEQDSNESNDENL